MRSMRCNEVNAVDSLLCNSSSGCVCWNLLELNEYLLINILICIHANKYVEQHKKLPRSLLD